MNRNNNLTIEALRKIAQPNYSQFLKVWGVTRQAVNYYKKSGIPSSVFNDLNAKTGGKLNQFLIKQDIDNSEAVELEVDLNKL